MGTMLHVVFAMLANLAMAELSGSSLPSRRRRMPSKNMRQRHSKNRKRKLESYANKENYRRAAERADDPDVATLKPGDKFNDLLKLLKNSDRETILQTKEIILACFSHHTVLRGGQTPAHREKMITSLKSKLSKVLPKDLTLDELGI